MNEKQIFFNSSLCTHHSAFLMKSYQQIRCQRCRAVNPLGEELRGGMVQGCRGRAAQQFAQLVNEGFAAFDREEKQAIEDGWRLLERAAALAPENATLNTLLGRQHFGVGKLKLARSYLERA